MSDVEPTFDLNDSRRRIGPLSVLDVGTGDAVVFLHGIGSSSTSFIHQIQALSNRYRCIAVDALGYGHSEDPTFEPDKASISNYVASVVSMLDASQLTHAALVGASWGGVIAAEFAARHHDRVWALVLADTSRGSGRDPERAAAMRTRTAELAELGVEEFARRRAPRLVNADPSDPLVARVAASMAQAIRPAGYGPACEAMAGADSSTTLPHIDTPTLVVVGDQDQVCPPAEAKTIQGLIPGARFESILAAGHLSNQEQPDRFNTSVGAFLDAHRPTNPTTPTTGEHQP